MNQKLDAAVLNLVDALNTDADILDRLTRIGKKAGRTVEAGNAGG